MRKILISMLFIFSSLLSAQQMGMGDQKGNMKKKMKMFQTVPLAKATILQKGKAKMYCPACGMTLPMWYKTNHAATHNGHTKQYCSIHCVAEENIKNNANLKDIKVVDVKSLKFIDAKDAYYVVGSKKKGTMSMVSKYAFANKSDAQEFVKKFGGNITDFNGAYKAATNGLKKDMMMIGKRQAKAAKKGKMIYNKMCKKTDKKFSSTAEAKTFVMQNRLCGNLKGKKLQAVGIYLSRR